MAIAKVSPWTRAFPTSLVWPMGFSWSSAVAQDTTLATCVQAGIHETSILSPDHDPPACQDELVLVATDDTVLFHRDVARGKKTLQSLDAAFRANGIPRNCAKDVTLAPEITALGCELSSSPPVAEPVAGRLGKAIQRTVDLLRTGVASPRGLHALLGVWEWFALLQRGFFSIYKDSYDFVVQTPEHEPARLPNTVLTECLVTLLLSPLLSAGLDRLPLNTLIAADASPDFGFGVVASPCSATVASEVCRLAERRGDFVHGYLLGLKWAARDPRKHHSKLPCLVDAKAVVGAAAKGRSSARTFLTVLRSAAAYGLAAYFLPGLSTCATNLIPQMPLRTACAGGEERHGKQRPARARRLAHTLEQFFEFKEGAAVALFTQAGHVLCQQGCSGFSLTYRQLLEKLFAACVHVGLRDRLQSRRSFSSLLAVERPAKLGHFLLLAGWFSCMALY
ncbi:unnamed protein product [Symbiodinium sp. CCMP2592]|nr:unnamed protein product [Symbiodinium sp. CCMP2592]